MTILSFAEDFETLSLLHVATLVVCLGCAAAPPLYLRKNGNDLHHLRVRRMVGWGCVVAWIVNTIYWLWPSRFSMEDSLPLHFCNFANLLGALALLRGIRLFQGVIYFWSSLYIWAFLTPTVGLGPAYLGFWIFWFYHLFIAMALVHTLTVDRFRPTFRDLLQCSGFTLSCVLILAIMNAIGGWNYGFVGNDVPGAPTPVDVLGPYPLRILWMILIGATAFTILWLPFRRSSQEEPR